MIQGKGNVELPELWETIPEVQCSGCLLYCYQDIAYCTCGHLLGGNQSSRHFHQFQLDLSIWNYVIKKGRPHGNRHEKTEEQRTHYIAHKLRKRCIQKRFWRNSRSFPERFNILWIATQHWSNWRSMHPDEMRRKTSPIAFRKTSTLDSKRIEGSLSTHLAEMHRWNSDQTSAKH